MPVTPRGAATHSRAGPRGGIIGADLIVMMDPIFADHAPWSVLAKVVRDAKCPVLAVRGHFG